MTCKPNFLYIGTAKAASTWLYRALDEHPEVFVPAAKDICYFDRSYHLGETWYFDHFKPGKKYAARGDISHDYFMSRDNAERILATLGRIKMIYCLREPVDLLLSAYQYDKVYRSFSKGLIHQPTLAEFAELARFRGLTNYYENLHEFYDVFPHTLFLPLFFEDLKASPAHFIHSVYEFLEVDADFKPSNLERKENVAQAGRFPLVLPLLFKVVQSLRKMGLANTIGKLKGNRILQALFYRPLNSNPSAVEQHDEEQLSAIGRRLHKNDDKLEALIGRPLPDSWNKYRD